MSQAHSSENCENATPKSLPRRIDTSLTSAAVFSASRLPIIGSCAVEAESSARLLLPPQPFVERMQPRRLRIEAWKREIERERLQNPPNQRSIARSALSVVNALVQPTQQGD
jgi:hypothetical protein